MQTDAENCGEHPSGVSCTSFKSRNTFFYYLFFFSGTNEMLQDAMSRIGKANKMYEGKARK